jgi:hypothetical protein
VIVNTGVHNNLVQCAAAETQYALHVDILIKAMS